MNVLEGRVSHRTDNCDDSCDLPAQCRRSSLAAERAGQLVISTGEFVCQTGRDSRSVHGALSPSVSWTTGADAVGRLPFRRLCSNGFKSGDGQMGPWSNGLDICSPDWRSAVRSRQDPEFICSGFWGGT